MIISDAGETLNDYLNYESVPVSCKYFFENGKQINAFANAESFANEAEAVAGEPIQNVLNYLSASQKLYNRIGIIFLNHPIIFF